MSMAMVNGREMSYAEYINSREWQMVRERYKESGLKKICYCCDAHDQPLDLHHKSYKRLGHERLNDLCRACQQCHRKIHRLVEERGWDIWRATRHVRRQCQRKRRRNL